MNNTEPKSPFLVFQDFISPKQCERIVDILDWSYPDINTNDLPIKSTKMNEDLELEIFEKFQPKIKEIEKHYEFGYRGTEPMYFEWFPEGCQGEEPHCENSTYSNKGWTRTKDRDLTAVLFLSDHQEKTPFDDEFEVMGGKLEFYSFQFGFNPQIGTLIIFPSSPHFINNTSEILVGDLFQVRFHITGNLPYIYSPEHFPGTYEQWFEKFA